MVSSSLLLSYHPFIHSSNTLKRQPPTQQRAYRWQITFKTLDEESDNRVREIESAKDDLLARSKTGNGHWKEELASQSESIVKAERGGIETNEETIRKLQEETKRVTVVKE